MKITNVKSTTAKEKIIVIDFGGQYKELIASKIRQMNVYSEIVSNDITADEVKAMSPIGIILTGGPKSVYMTDSPKCDPKIFSLGIPVLGICYGMQLLCYTLGGNVGKASGSGEFGRIRTNIFPEVVIFKDFPSKITALMSHGDEVKALPEGFKVCAHTSKCKIAACFNEEKKLYGVQFHPEVKHTEDGLKILENFIFNVCGASGDYNIDDYIETTVKSIRSRIGEKKVLLALSGGVDSSVCAALIEKAIGDRLTCVFVDHGLMRKDEGDRIEKVFSERNLNFIRVNAEKRFLDKLSGVTDPEKKRKIIGAEFIAVFEEESCKLGNIPFLAQGTIYPDIIESGGNSKSGGAAKIKSHHNVGGLPENIGFDGIIEPLSGLFKDEVRMTGNKLGLPSYLVQRQPFPGPGLAVRIVGEITKEKLDLLRDADAIACEEIGKMKNPPDQYFAVLPGVNSVGVTGDERAYKQVVAVRAVSTSDFMTCEYARLSHTLLSRISMRITNEVPGVGRVVYDITGKPPATVEWE